MNIFRKHSRDLNKYLINLLNSSKIMAIIFFIILSFSSSCYSTAGWAEEYIVTKNGNVIYTCEEDIEKGIVLCKRGEYNYFVTNIQRYSYSFYPNYILGKCSKGLFSFNETTYEVKYFINEDELNKFKKENYLGYSYEEKDNILYFSITISFFTLVILFFILIFWKNTEIDISHLKTKFVSYYLFLYFLTKVLNFVIGYISDNNPEDLFPTDNLSLILLYSVFLVFPWFILYRDFKKVNSLKGLKGYSALFVLFLILDFWVITASYYFSGFVGHSVIIFTLICNLPFIILYLFVYFVSAILIKIGIKKEIP